MTERPWESDDDRKRVRKSQESDRAFAGCFLWACVAFGVFALLIFIGIMDWLSGA